MKKIFFALLAIAATMNVMATVTKQAKLTLTAGAAKGDVYVIETDEDVTDYNAIMNMSGRYIALYAMNEGKKYEVFATDNLSELALGLKTNAETSYTITATDVIGTITIKLLDGSLFVIDQEGATTTFTAPANTEEVTGLEVNPRAIPTEFKVCHQYGKIIVDNPTTEPMDVVLDGEKIGEAAAQTFASEVTVTAAAGQHTLEINNQTLIISVQ